MKDWAKAARLAADQTPDAFVDAVRTMKPNRPKPSECPVCEYDRRFPGFEAGGWMQQDNNGPIVSCPLCNDDGSFAPRP